MALLTCSDVTFSYEGIPVLTDVNFALEAGSYLCIVGENGSGKSTLIKGLLHLKNPSTGSITTGDGLHRAADRHSDRRGIFLFHQPVLHLPGAENHRRAEKLPEFENPVQGERRGPG